MKSLLMVVRGFLIGTAEAIPGISGGTVALIVGIYRFLIDSISNFFLLLLGGVNRSAKPSKPIPWSQLGLIFLGMAAGLLIMARVIEPLLVNYPSVVFSFFGGLVLASVYYPLRLAGAKSWINYGWIVPGVLVGLLLSGELLQWRFEPITSVAAAIAVSALVVPGISGSFLLLLLGAYETTISALNSFDIAYLASFAAGALVGLVTIVFALRWLLQEYPQLTYLFMSGLMLGSLPALFPELSPEVVEFELAIAAFTGILLVAIFIVLERRIKSSSSGTEGQ